MKLFTAAAWILATAGVALAAGTTTTVTVAPSSLSYKQVLAACPKALAGMSFTLHHLRIAEAPGVASDISSNDPNAQSVVLTLGKLRAQVSVNAATHAVTAKAVTLSAGKKVACIAHD